MNSYDSIVRQVISASRIVGAGKRAEVERELRSHIEDLVLEARENGYNDRTIDQLVTERFGSPSLVASGFADVYRRERIAVYVSALVLLGAVSLAAVSAFVYVVQFGLSAGLGLLPDRVSSAGHLRQEVVLLAGITFGYLAMYFAERLFAKHRTAKALCSGMAVFALLALGLEYWTRANGVVLMSGVCCALVVRLIEVSQIRRWVQLAAVAMFMTVYAMGMLSCLRPSERSGSWMASLAFCLAIAVSFQILTYLATVFDRQMEKV